VSSSLLLVVAVWLPLSPCRYPTTPTRPTPFGAKRYAERRARIDDLRQLVPTANVLEEQSFQLINGAFPGYPLDSVAAPATS